MGIMAAKLSAYLANATDEQIEEIGRTVEKFSSTGHVLKELTGLNEMKHMNRFIMKCPYCGFECETGEMLPLEIMELNNMVIDCGNCGKEIKITKETFKEND